MCVRGKVLDVSLDGERSVNLCDTVVPTFGDRLLESRTGFKTEMKSAPPTSVHQFLERHERLRLPVASNRRLDAPLVADEKTNENRCCCMQAQPLDVASRTNEKKVRQRRLEKSARRQHDASATHFACCAPSSTKWKRPSL